MSESPWLELLQNVAFIALGVLILALVLLTLRNGLASLGLYMDRMEGDAKVEAEYRRLGLFRRVRYSFWSPAGMITGTAPAHCVRQGCVPVAWRPTQPHWHRPRDLMFDDVLLAASFWLAVPVVVALRVLAALRAERG